MKIGNRDEFHSERCYQRYLYAIKLAKQVNEYIDKGYVVFQNGGWHRNKFVFYSWDKPRVSEVSGNVSFCWVGSSFDTDGRVWIDETKEEIAKMFSDIIIFNPKYSEKLCLK